jgi:hypothetical protein
MHRAFTGCCPLVQSERYWILASANSRTACSSGTRLGGGNFPRTHLIQP